MKQTLYIPYIAQLDAAPDLDVATTLVGREGARADIACVNWVGQFDDAPASTAYVAHSRDAIYIVFTADEPHVRAVVDKDMGPVSSDSCFEFFVEPAPETHRYWNFEFNAIGHLNASHRVERPNATRFDQTMLNAVERRSNLGDEPFGEKDVDRPWTLTVRIPLALINLEYAGEPLRMRGNIYKCASAKTPPHYLSWLPIDTVRPDFHRPEFFGTMVLE